MPSITITTSVKDDIYKQIKEKGLKFNNMIYLGWQSLQGFPEIAKRQREADEKIAELEAKNLKLYLVTQRMRQEVDKLLDNIERPR